jgi:cystathionine beta-lyase family protein involved in aluminum resistance
MNKQELIKKIRDTSEYFLDIINLIERAATYKTRQHIKLSDVEIKDIIKNGTHAMIVIITNSLCYEEFLETKGLDKEALAFIQEIIDEFQALTKEKK